MMARLIRHMIIIVIWMIEMMTMIMQMMMLIIWMIEMMMLRSEDTSDQRVHEIANTFVKFRHAFCLYHKKFLAAEMLNAFCVALSIYICDVLLNHQFFTYGYRVILVYLDISSK